MYLGIVESESGSPGLSRDLIRDCNLDMWLLDSSAGVFAITSLGALFAIVSLPYWQMRFTVIRSCTASMVIVCGRGCCNSGTVIPLFNDRCSATDNLVWPVRYRHCTCVTLDLIRDHIRDWNWRMKMHNSVSLNSALNSAWCRTRWSHVAGTAYVCKPALDCNFVASYMKGD